MIYIVLGTLGLLGNLLIIIVMFSAQVLRRKVLTMYLINQSVLDMCASLLLIISAPVYQTGVPFTGLAAEFYCRLWLNKLPLWSLFLSSTFNLMAITLDRYLKVVHYTWYRVKVTTRSKVMVPIAATWLFGFGFNAVYMIPTTQVISYTETNLTCSIYRQRASTSVMMVLGIVIFCIQYLLPLLVFVFCYGRIIYVLHVRMRRPTPDKMARESWKKEDADFKRGRNNTIQTLIVVATCFALCWGCNQVIYLCYNFGVGSTDFTKNTKSMLYYFSVLAVYANCCINPFIYACKYTAFQDACKQLFTRCCMCKQRENNNSSANMSAQGRPALQVSSGGEYAS